MIRLSTKIKVEKEKEIGMKMRDEASSSLSSSEPPKKRQRKENSITDNLNMMAQTDIQRLDIEKQKLQVEIKKNEIEMINAESRKMEATNQHNTINLLRDMVNSINK